ncbi:MAG: hypothetical protein ACR2IE_02930 [Candidatus Sumerlaeaceae bacterium]
MTSRACRRLLYILLLFGIGLPVAQYFAVFSPGLRSYVWVLIRKPPQWLTWLLLAELLGSVLFVATLLKTSARDHRADSASPALLQSPPLKRLLYGGLATCVLFGSAALGLHFSSGYEGDYTGWIKIANKPDLIPSEPLGRWSHYACFKMLEVIGVASNDLAMRVSSVLSGCLFIAAIWVFGRRALPYAPRTVVILILLFSPLIALFCGYRENTPLAYALSATYLLLGLRYIHLRLRRSPWPETLVLALAIWSHGAICFLTAAHLVLAALWFMRTHNIKQVEVFAALQLFALCIAPFMPLVLTMAAAYILKLPGPWFGNALGGGDLGMFVDFTGHPTGSQHTIWSRTYWLNIANLIVYACPVLPVVLYAATTGTRAKDPATCFLTAGFLGMLALALTWNPDIGYIKDFDLLAGFAIPAHLLLLHKLQHCTPRCQLGFALPYAVINLTLHVLPFSEAI